MNKNNHISLRVTFGCSLLAGAILSVAAIGCGPKDDDSTPIGSGGSGGGSSNSGGTGGGSSGTGGNTSANGGGTGTGGGGGAVVVPGNMGGSSGGGASGAGTTITDLETGFHYFDDKTPGVATGVTGAWFSYADMSVGATLTPPAGMDFKPTMPGYNNSKYAACLKGSGYTMWGAGMGFNLNDPGDGKGGSAVASFNASPYKGFTFWAKAAAPLTIKFKVPMKSTDPAGKVCMGEMAMACYNHPAAEVPLTTEWKQYTVEFASLMQEPDWGLRAAFNPMEVFGVRLEVGKDAGSFDFCVDNFAFVK